MKNLWALILGLGFVLAIVLGGELVRAASSPDTAPGTTIRCPGTDCYRVPDGSTTTLIIAHTICKVINNGSGKDIFVPTRTAAEWNKFYSNAPARVIVTSCGGAGGTGMCGLTGGTTPIAHGGTATAYAASSVSCGNTCSSRTVTCNNGVFSPSGYNYASCSVAATNGGWSAWSAWSGWSTCSVSCGGGTQTRTHTRTCNNPVPACGGTTCSGPATETESQACGTGSCGPPNCANVNPLCQKSASVFRLNAAGGGCGAGYACNADGSFSGGTCTDCPCASCVGSSGGDCGAFQDGIARPRANYKSLGFMTQSACRTACSNYAGASCCEWSGSTECYAEWGDCTPVAVSGWSSAECVP